MPNGIHPPGGGRPCSGGFRGERAPANFPRFRFAPYTYHVPRNRCDLYDRHGRCCNQNACCTHTRDYSDEGYPLASAARQSDGWYGIPGVWNMMPGMEADDDGAGDI